MTVSLFSATVARGIEVPVTDPRLETHIEYTSRVDTDDQGSAEQADQTTETDVLDAPEPSKGRSTTDATTPAGDE